MSDLNLNLKMTQKKCASAGQNRPGHSDLSSYLVTEIIA